ncbi:MAG: hypothetical protein RMJ51_00925 [Candidatus Calescibacterium sp.]|nr:hypothetical protein [Candidatus Calescibacterium sp.]MCX7972108.1 hypothetical protein [bacterium]MDW8194796.1 hypothetical protein [Candidatus Calescibacterium sp.]
MNILELIIFILILFLLVFVDGFTRILYLSLKYKPDFFMYSLFRFSIIILIILLFIKIFPNFYYYAIGFLVYLLLSGLIWRKILKIWYQNYLKKEGYIKDSVKR